MPESRSEQALIVFFRVMMGWTFLYAASHQAFDPTWSVAGFLGHTKTFHALFAPLTAPAIAPEITFLVGYGHLLIGLSLIFGLMVRLSAAFGVLLMVLYWMAHMDFPYISDPNNFIVDFHVVYAGLLVYLILKHAGQVCGLDALAGKLRFFNHHPQLRPLVS
jgi:thiosulfate dehydrogenase [quinone] large subunit